MSRPPSQFDREEREVEFARALAFSDGVFAFAVTLLVTTIEVPDVSGPNLDRALWEALKDLSPNLTSYGISFAVIGLMWMHHHRLFSRIRRLNGAALWLNLLSLAFIVLMPFSTELLGRYDEEPVAVCVYALNIALATASYTLLWWYCLRHDMLGETLTPRQIRLEVLARTWITAGFLLSMPIAFLGHSLAQLFWGVSAITQGLVSRRLERREGLPVDDD